VRCNVVCGLGLAHQLLVFLARPRRRLVGLLVVSWDGRYEIVRGLEIDEFGPWADLSLRS
jgi:hypothetical protein